MGKTSRTYRLKVTTQAQQLVSESEKRVFFMAYNNGTAKVYVLSAQNLTSDDGIPVAVGSHYKNDTSTAAFWIIAESDTQDIRVEVDSK